MNQIHIQEKLGKEDVFPNNNNKVNGYWQSHHGAVGFISNFSLLVLNIIYK